jgi:hypothetical protein
MKQIIDPFGPGGSEIIGLQYIGSRVRIPMEACDVLSGMKDCTNLTYYQKWYNELLHFSELLQNSSLRFNCED